MRLRVPRTDDVIILDEVAAASHADGVSEFQAIFGHAPAEAQPELSRPSDASRASEREVRGDDHQCFIEDFFQQVRRVAREVCEWDGTTDATATNTAIIQRPTYAQFFDTITSCSLCNFVKREVCRYPSMHASLYSNHGDEPITFKFFGKHEGEEKSARPTFGVHLSGDSVVGFELVPIIDDDDQGETIGYPRELTFIDDDPRDERAMSKMISWVRQCDRHLCRGSEAETIRTRLPTRVIDVGTERNKTLCLHVSAHNESAPYVALSYCWGGYNGVILTRSKLEAFQLGLDEATLPQTYTDAIFLTRKLGIQYLWIDALCIIQDSESDWESESSKMSEVFENAALTLSAANSPSAEHGFLSKRSARTNTHALCGTVSHASKEFPVYLKKAIRGLDPLVAPLTGYLSNEPLTSRGWTVQERTLSKRIMHFGTQQMIWQCPKWTCLEDGKVVGPQDSLYTSSEHTAVHQWYKIAEQYSQCMLTQLTDRPHAIEGLATAFERLIGGGYSCGHWREGLFNYLIWTDGKGVGHIRGRYAPSWSWCSVPGTAIFHSIDIMPKYTEIATLLTPEIFKTHDDPAKESSLADLRIRTPLAMATIHCKLKSQYVGLLKRRPLLRREALYVRLKYFPLTKLSSRIPGLEISLDTRPPKDGHTRVKCAIALVSHHTRAGCRRYCGILLEAVGGSDETVFRRVGMIWLHFPPLLFWTCFRSRDITII